MISISLPSKEKKQRPDLMAVIEKPIPSGATFTQFVREMGVATDTAAAILNSAKGKYDLAKIVSNRDLVLVFNNLTGDLEKLIYEIDTEEELIVNKNGGEWQAEVKAIPYEVKQKEANGIISESLFKTIKDYGNDIRLALSLAETFAWHIDFAADIRAGDTFKVIYEERHRDGQYVMPGRVLAAKFINDGEEFKGYNFHGKYYDQNGKSLQKIFLKSPLQHKYISSGFSYSRVNPITKKISPHRGIDYAADYGTPAVSVGDGTVIQAGWNGYYGISTTVRHNDTYKTIYGHFSRLAKGIIKGAKVKQGQVVGYVGSTGQSTGPHLHYEMHKFGSHVNPFKVEIPPGENLPDGNRLEFEKIMLLYPL